MNEQERTKIKAYIEQNAIEIEVALNTKLREMLKKIGVDTTDLNALSQAQNTFLKHMTGG